MTAREYLAEWAAYVSAGERKQAARRGFAMPDGSFPIRNERELRAAVRLNGSSKTYSVAQVRAHIRKRAAALGLTKLVPSDWSGAEKAFLAHPFMPQDDGLCFCGHQSETTEHRVGAELAGLTADAERQQWRTVPHDYASAPGTPADMCAKCGLLKGASVHVHDKAKAAPKPKVTSTTYPMGPSEGAARVAREDAKRSTVRAIVHERIPAPPAASSVLAARAADATVHPAALTWETASLLLEVGDHLILTSQAQLRDDVELAGKANPTFLYLSGRYVQAGQCNDNGAYWSIADLQHGEPTIPNVPINMLHDMSAIVGTMTDAAVQYPEAAGALPFIQASGVMWKHYFPRVADLVETAARSGSLSWSMECVPRTVRCETSTDGLRQGCGREVAYAEVASAGCEHLRNKTSQRRMVNPDFVASGLILPPVQPAWRDAHVGLLQEAASRCETLPSLGLPDEQMCNLVAGVLRFARHLDASRD